jgi:hypothetical protein
MSTVPALTIRHYLAFASGRETPPFVFEVILKSGRSFVVKYVFPIQDENPDLILFRV